MPSRAERERTQQRRALRLLADAPEGMTEALMMAHGFNSELLVDLCIAGLAIAKVEPLNRALLDLDCWITGIRREQSSSRADAPKLGWDAAHELWKANPLADWSDEDCWAYIRERGLPYNALHDQGYDSIGDVHSTIPGAGREGRWAGSERTECGLHVGTTPEAG